MVMAGGMLLCDADKRLLTVDCTGTFLADIGLATSQIDCLFNPPLL